MWERESLPSFSSPHLITPAPVRTTELESFRTELCTGAATVRPKIWIRVYWVWAQSTKPASLAAHGKHRRVLGIRSVLAGKAHSFRAHHVCRKQKKLVDGLHSSQPCQNLSLLARTAVQSSSQSLAKNPRKHRQLEARGDADTTCHLSGRIS